MLLKINMVNRYNTNIHHRRSIRLKGYDYSRAGLYFITICCHDRICRFGSVENGEMALNEFGAIAHDEWLKLPERFHPVEFDIGAYKSLVANGCLDIIFNPTEWQRNKFYRT